MSDGFLPPVIIEMIADAKQFFVTKNAVVGGVKEIGAAGDVASAKLSHIGQRLSTGLLFGVAGALAYGLKAAIDFEHHLENLSLIAGVTGDELKYVKDQVLAVSSETSTANTKISDAYVLVEQAGYRGAKATEIVRAAAEASKITHSDLNETVKSLLVTQNLQIKGTKDVAATTGFLVDSLSHGTKSFEDTASLLKGKLALAFKTYGLDISSAISANNIFSKAQINGTKASMGLAGVIEKLIKPSESTGKLLGSIGLNQQKVAEDLKKPNGLITVFTELRSGFDNFASAADKKRGFGAFFSQMFGGKTGAAAQALLNFAPEFAKGLGSSADAAKLLADRFAEWQKNTTEGKLATFQTALQNFEVALGETLLPAASKVLEWINTFAEKIRKDKNFRESVKTAFEVAIGLAIGVKLLPVMNKLLGMFKTSSVVANTGAVGLNTGATQLNTAALVALRTGLIGAGILTGVETAGAAAIGAGAIEGVVGAGLLAAAAPFAAAFVAVAAVGLGVWWLSTKHEGNVNTPEQDQWMKDHPVNPNTGGPTGPATPKGMNYGQWKGMTMTKYGLDNRHFNLLGQEYLSEGHSFKDWQAGKANIPQLERAVTAKDHTVKFKVVP